MPTLRPAQSLAVSRIWKASRLLLADVGAGKTATALRAIRTRGLNGGRKRVLVLGTLRICKMVWGEEIKLWAPELTYASAAGCLAERRIQRLEDESLDVVALNFENLAWAVSHFGERLPRLFPWLIIDESSRLENPAAKSFRAIKPLLPKFEWRLAMTGTPRANHLHDLWGSAYLAGLAGPLGEYKEAFLQRWFMEVQRRTGNAWIPKQEAEEEIYERLADTVHRMPFKSPEPVEIDVLLPLNSVVRGVQESIDACRKKGHPNITLNGITYVRDGCQSSLKQLQLASGCVYNDGGYPVKMHADKLAALIDIVAEAKGEPIMVVFQFDHERDTILTAFPQARVLDGETALFGWNAGRIEILLVHPLSCGHGLNAQFSGSSLQVWFSPTYDAELYTQTIGRLNRPGNPHTVRVMRLIMQGTRDIAAYQTIASRQRDEAATLRRF